MRIVNYVMILFFLTKIYVVCGETVFESFVYQETPFESNEDFQNVDLQDSFDTPEDSNFVTLKSNSDSIGKLDTGFEAEKMVKIKEVSKDFESTGPEVEDRVLTDAQKNSQKIFEQRLKEDRRKQEKLMALQEQEYLNMRQKVWKAFEAKANGITKKGDSSFPKQQKAIQAQSLLQQLQATKNALVEKDKLANDLADKLAKVNAQRVTAALRLQVQKATRRALSGSVNSKTKQGNAQLMQARNQEQINTDTFLRLDKQFNNLNTQLQDARNQAQNIRAQFQQIQQTIDQQLPQVSDNEEVY